MMGDQKFSCGRYKGRTFQEIAQIDPDFCEAVLKSSVLKSSVCNKYYPEEFKLFLESQKRTSICESNVKNFIKKWDKSIEDEFCQIIGSPEIEIRRVHPQAAGYPNGELGVFIRYFIKKCISNVQQNVDEAHFNIEIFASIFPFKVSKTVPMLVKLPVRQLFDDEFYTVIKDFTMYHFGDKLKTVDDIIDLFLHNIYQFKKKHFDPPATQKLKNVVDDALNANRSSFTVIYVNDYLRQFPRLNQAGITRYSNLRKMYNNLCASFGRELLGDQRRRHYRMLPEINCYELLSLLEPDFFVENRPEYVKRFKKYLFFFTYAIDSKNNCDNPLFFIDDVLYECLKGYVEYRSSLEVPENLKWCIWCMTLIHRRTQELHFVNNGKNYEMDEENLRNIRNYVENFPGIETAVIDYVLPTNLILLGIPVVTNDTIFNVFYTKSEKSNLSDFYEGIIRALMCPLNIKNVVIYNAYLGMEASVTLPSLKKEVLEFVRKYNKYDPTQPMIAEFLLTSGLEVCFETNTIQWNDKYPRKSVDSPSVYKYKEICNS